MKDRGGNIKKILEKRKQYDSTPDTNIERLEKDMIDISLEPSSKREPQLLKEIKKKKKKEKPIKTSLLLCYRRA
jgi:hypothetical protein